jgi:hypothetical protein
MPSKVIMIFTFSEVLGNFLRGVPLGQQLLVLLLKHLLLIALKLIILHSLVPRHLYEIFQDLLNQILNLIYTF